MQRQAIGQRYVKDAFVERPVRGGRLLHVRIEQDLFVSQPPPFSPRSAQTAIVPGGTVGFDTGQGGVVSLPATTSADELATALNALGVEPRDLIAIFQALKEAGALPGKMEIL